MSAVASPRVSGAAVQPAVGGASLARMREAAQRFEAQALGALLQPVFGQAPKGLISGGAAEAQWRPMLVENYARGWAARGGVGIANAVLAEMVRSQARRELPAEVRGELRAEAGTGPRAEARTEARAEGRTTVRAEGNLEVGTPTGARGTTEEPTR